MTHPAETAAYLQEILSLAQDALDECGVPVVAATVLTGTTQAKDFCCATKSGANGQLYIRIVRITKTQAFPTQSLDPRNCELPNALYAEIGVVRCGPTVDRNGNSPKPEDLTASSLQVIEDMSILHDVLVGHRPPWADFNLVIDTWTPWNPQGGCVGGQWRFAIAPKIMACCETSPTSPPDTSPEE